MRKLKLQMQITADGFVAGPEGQLDGMSHAMDEQLKALISELADASDTILMGRKMTGGFIKYWEHAITQPESLVEYPFARKMVDIPKVVFSKTLDHVDGQNVRVENGDLSKTVGQLKRAPGKDIIVYGGATFVSSFILSGFILGVNVFVIPAGVGAGRG